MTEKKILVVDDDLDTCRLLCRYLRQEGYHATHAHNGRQMWQLRQKLRPDLIILDLNMPGENGFTLARRLRSISEIPIIIVSAQAATHDRVIGLELGADDYLAKPFDKRELLARIHNLVRRQIASRRNERLPSRHGAASFSGWTLDLGARELRSPEAKNIHLTRHEYELLRTFIHKHNHALSREQMTDFVCGREWSPSDRSIDMLVGKLRKKLGDDPRQPALIQSVRGIGYKFTAPVQFG